MDESLLRGEGSVLQIQRTAHEKAKVRYGDLNTEQSL